MPNSSSVPPTEHCTQPRQTGETGSRSPQAPQSSPPNQPPPSQQTASNTTQPSSATAANCPYALSPERSTQDEPAQGKLEPRAAPSVAPAHGRLTAATQRRRQRLSDSHNASTASRPEVRPEVNRVPDQRRSGRLADDCRESAAFLGRDQGSAERPTCSNSTSTHRYARGRQPVTQRWPSDSERRRPPSSPFGTNSRASTPLDHTPAPLGDAELIAVGGDPGRELADCGRPALVLAQSSRAPRRRPSCARKAGLRRPLCLGDQQPAAPLIPSPPWTSWRSAGRRVRPFRSASASGDGCDTCLVLADPAQDVRQ